MKFVIVNLASPANPGDQAILWGTLKLLRMRFDKPKITIATRAISEKAAYEALGCRVVASYPNVDPMCIDSLSERLTYVPFSLADPGPLREAIRESDAVFYAGGAYLYSYRSFSPGLTYLSNFSGAHWAKKFKKPLILLPQSYGPFRSAIAHWFFDQAMKTSRHVFYRERISGDWLEKKYCALRHQSSFLPDLALYLTPEDLLGSLFPGESPGRILGVTVRPWNVKGVDENRYLENLAESLSRCHARWGFTVRIIVQVQADKRSEGDEKISRRLEELLVGRLGRERVEFYSHSPYFNLPDLCRLYQQCAMLVSTRLHSSLLAFILGRPALVIGYQHKAEGILRELELSDLYAGFYDSIQGGDFSAKLDRLWSEKDSWIEKINEVLSKTRREIEVRFNQSMRGIFP